MKVLVIEDSLVVRQYVCMLLREQPDIEVIEAGDGLKGLELARRAQPDVILTDLELPGLHGLEIIRRVMGASPCPIIVLSGHLNDGEVDMAFKAVEAGAVEVMAKPVGMGEGVQDRFRDSLLKTLRIMATVPVVKRYDQSSPAAQLASAPTRERPELVAIGASTGGPQLLHRMLRAWTAPLPVPLIIVQHISEGFEDSFARWLAESGHDVRLAIHGELICRGRVYVSPTGADLLVDGFGRLSLEPHRARLATSTNINALFHSVAHHYGQRSWGVLLTGMGADGAAGLLAMHERGALTIAQEGSSCTVDGMPAVARKMDAASLVMTPDQIIDMLGTGLEDKGPRP